jgi:predicted RNA binding protein YcfA (HicA-like mRNA interferase family)
MQKRTDEGTVTLPVPLHAELRRGTLQSIIRQSGVSRSLFEN